MNPIPNYFSALNAIGVLNYTSSQVSGEAGFLDQFLSRFKVPVVFDVGANVGGYTREILMRNPRAHVFAFEPHPTTFRSLAKFDADPNVQTFNLALGDAEGELDFFDYRDEDGSSHASLYREVIERIHGRAAVAHRVKVSTLAAVAKACEVSHIDLLKIDTEGHELPVLRGAEALIRAGEVEVIQFEFNEMNVSSRTFFKDFWDFLPEYDFFRLLPDGVMPIPQYVPVLCEIFAFQNIVCVRKGLSLF